MIGGVSIVSLDSKGRLAIPARHRETLLSAFGHKLVVTLESSDHLLIYPEPNWKPVEQRLLALPSGNPTLKRYQRLVLGRLDGRYTSLDVDAAGERQEFDPSNQALQGPYTATFQDYLRNELKWETELRYPTSGNVRPWAYDQNKYMDMTDALRGTMTRNPYLKVFVAIGYYDMATVMGGAEHNFTHLAYDKQVTDRVSYGYYEGGHMMYTRPSAHRALKNDIVKFVNETRAPRTATP